MENCSFLHVLWKRNRVYHSHYVYIHSTGDTFTTYIVQNILQQKVFIFNFSHNFYKLILKAYDWNKWNLNRKWIVKIHITKISNEWNVIWNPIENKTNGVYCKLLCPVTNFPRNGWWIVWKMVNWKSFVPGQKSLPYSFVHVKFIRCGLVFHTSHFTYKFNFL